MSPDLAEHIRQLEAELLQLEPVARAAIAKALLASLDDLPEQDYRQLWAEEAESRYDDFLAGRTTAVDGDEVFARVRARKRYRGTSISRSAT